MNWDEIEKLEIDKPLVKYCEEVYNIDSECYDNFYNIIIKKPYITIKDEMDISVDKMLYVKPSDVLSNKNNYKDYIITDIFHGSDCSINVWAEIPIISIIDFIKHFKQKFDNNIIFKDILADIDYSLDYINNHENDFINTSYVDRVLVNSDKKIYLINFMFSSGKF